MPILFSVVARGTVVLAKYATCAGNFSEVTEQILSKIPPHDDKLTYSHGNYLFHYIAENKLVFFCITDDKFQRSRAFLFLNEIKRRFTSAFGDTAQTAIPYAMNGEFARTLAAEMKHYSDSKDLDTISRVHGELDELKNIMVKNIGKNYIVISYKNLSWSLNWREFVLVPDLFSWFGQISFLSGLSCD